MLAETENLEAEAKALEDRITKVEQRQKDNDADKFNSQTKGDRSMTPVGHRSNSDESKALMYFGVSNVKDLLQVNTGAARFASVPAELKYLVLELKRDVDVCRMAQQILGGEPLDTETKAGHVKGVLEGSSYARNVLAPRLKAFSSTGAGVGLEWVPTAVSAQYVDEYQLNREVASKFKAINMPSDPYNLTTKGGSTIARKQAESGTITGTNFTTSKIQFDAIKLSEFMPLSSELNEDSAPDILGLIRSEVIESNIRAVETSIINGDSDGTHQDYDSEQGGADLAVKCWNGLIKLGMANSANGGNKSFSGAAVTETPLRDMRVKMGKYGVNPKELMWLLSTKVYNEFLSLSNVVTVEKMGQLATVLSGQLGAFDGIPIVISEYMRDDVAASGFNTMAGPNTFSRIALVNRTRFYWATRRPIQVKALMDPTPPADQWLVASWWRGDFKGHTQGAISSGADVSVVVGYNIV
jgi:HK97 family phage major capsid protein